MIYRIPGSIGRPRFAWVALLVIVVACGGWIGFAPADRAQHDRSSTSAVDEAHTHPAYQRLRAATERYRQIADDGGWPDISAGELLQEGDTSARVIPLRERLAVTGDLSAPVFGDSAYDNAVAEAVLAFQRRHGLTEDGVLGPETRGALNVSAREKVRQMERNLRRWESLPEDLGDRYVLVNIPEFRVRAYRQDDEEFSMRIIVGAEYDSRATPLFSDRMEYVVFRPYWNIPASIATDEILPEARQDRSYLTRNGYQIVSHYAPDARVYDVHSTDLDRVASGELRLRQKPGPQNALGLVKFMFPNEYAVYLHGTPHQHLFEEGERAFSHGCIRVEHPDELAEFVLSRQGGWTPERIDEAMQAGERQQVDLEETFPVYILYFTVFVDEDGTVGFFKDLYGHDSGEAGFDLG